MPHCSEGEYDDAHHAACGCKHPILNNMVSDRHNAAVHKLVDDIHKAHHESPWHLIVHAGVKYNEHATPGSKLPSTTIPQWALPGCTECPDVVLLLGWDETMPIPSDNSLVEFVIADLTYCRGDCSLAAISRKQNKYDGIADRLRARGFRVRGFTEHSLLPKEGREVYATHIAVLALGISGEVYKATHHVMSALGLDAQAISKLTKALHVHGLTQTDSILALNSQVSRQYNSEWGQRPHHHQYICHSTSADWAPARRHHRNCTTSACWGRLGGGDRCVRSRSLLTRLSSVRRFAG